MSGGAADQSGKPPLAVLENVSFSIDGQDQRVLIWNAKAAEVLGFRVRDIVKKVWHEVLAPPESRWEAAGRVDQACQAVERGEFSEVILHLVAADGSSSCMKFRVFIAESALPEANGHKAFKLFCLGHTPLSREVKPFPLRHAEVPGAGLATFATRDIEAGETVLEEEPFFTRLQPAAMRDRKEWDDEWAAEFNSIRAPLSFPAGADGGFVGAAPAKPAPLLASAALVRDALGFALAHHTIRDAIMKLSSPPLDLDHALVKVSYKVAALCQRRLKECRGYPVELLQTAILTTEMNTFPGGRMFWTLSRLNHSCSPNCVFLSVPGRWGVRALRPVTSGEELTISYLGEELVWPTVERRRILWRSKAFLCACPRCTEPVDRLLDRPCVRCASLRCVRGWKVVHNPGVYCRSEPSTAGKAVGFIPKGTVLKTTGRVERAEEGSWVELDPKRYAQGGWALISGERLAKRLGELLAPMAVEADAVPAISDSAPPVGHWLWGGHPRGQAPRRQGALEQRFRQGYGKDGYTQKELDEVVRLDSGDLLQFELPDFLDKLESSGEEVPYAHFEGACWRCPRCDHTESHPALLQLERDLGEKARKFFSMQGLTHFDRVDSGSRKLPMPPDIHVCALFRLADDARAVFGRRHYAWQLGLLFSADLDTSLPKYVNFRRDGAFYLHTICGLLELWDWLRSCGVSQDPSLWLHHRASELLLRLSNMHSASGLFKLGSGPESETLAELRRRVEEAAAAMPVDLLGPREFIPEGLFPAS